MIIRTFRPEDFVAVQKIHEKHYSKEFDLPDFAQNFICAFVIEDEGEIISAGGVRPIAEAIIITNKDMSTRKRFVALKEALEISIYLTRNRKFDELHAFIQDSEWKNHLMKYGFHPCKGEGLVLNLRGANG